MSFGLYSNGPDRILTGPVGNYVILSEFEVGGYVEHGSEFF